MNKLRTDFEGLMTLGELIDFLEAVEDKTKNVVTSGGTYVSGFSSYRGYYEDLAITPSGGYSEESSILNVEQFLEKAKDAVNHYFTGWKGGEYQMSRDNGLWISHEGQCTGVGLERAEELEFTVVLFGKTTSDT